MEIIAGIYLASMVLEWLAIPFIFGKSRGHYTPKFWLIHVLVHAPLVWLLWQVMVM